MRRFSKLFFVFLTLHCCLIRPCIAAEQVVEQTVAERTETTGGGESSTTTTLEATEQPAATTADASSNTEGGGPLVDLLGPKLLQLVMVDEKKASVQPLATHDALRNKQVIGIYFSADWCPACVQFTPELVQFHTKINQRRKTTATNDAFTIVWVSRCRDINAFSQYMASIPNFLALPPEEAMGARGEQLMRRYGVKGIPTLILLDESGSIITKEGRTKIPQDKAGIGFPWRNPFVQLYMTLVPRRVRRKVKEQLQDAQHKVAAKVKQVLFPTKSKVTTTAAAATTAAA